MCHQWFAESVLWRPFEEWKTFNLIFSNCYPETSRGERITRHCWGSGLLASQQLTTIIDGLSLPIRWLNCYTTRCGGRKNDFDFKMGGCSAIINPFKGFFHQGGLKVNQNRLKYSFDGANQFTKCQFIFSCPVSCCCLSITHSTTTLPYYMTIKVLITATDRRAAPHCQSSSSPAFVSATEIQFVSLSSYQNKPIYNGSTAGCVVSL